MTNEEKKPTDSPANDSPEVPRRRRRHGYRGYPNRNLGGEVHWGTGFSGVGAFGASSNALPRAGVLTEKTESAARREPS